jgi:hypothetical protein
LLAASQLSNQLRLEVSLAVWWPVVVVRLLVALLLVVVVV